MIDSVFRKGKNYTPQVFFEGCKYIFKEKHMSKYITDNFEVSWDEENSIKENSDEENSDEKNYSEK